ncbi:MAG: hypothetical protein ABI678_11660 [Kofleriaceae bacterium]
MTPKHLKRVVIAASIVIMLGVVTAVIVVMSGGTKSAQHGPPSTADLIEIEVRSNPRARVYYNLRDVGLSPVTLHVPRSDQPIDLAMSLKGRALIKHVVPDHPQTVDFFVP